MKSNSWRMLYVLRRPIIVVAHLLLVVVSNVTAVLLRFDGRLPPGELLLLQRDLIWLLVLRGTIFIPFRLYEGLWRYTSLWDLRNIVGGVVSSTVVFYLLVHVAFGQAVYPGSVLVVDSLLLVVLMGGVRMTRRVLVELHRGGRGGKRVLVFGAGDAGELVVRDMKNSGESMYHPIGFVDDDAAKVTWTIHGVPVLGTREDLPRIMRRYRPDEVLIAIPAANAAAIRGIVRMLEPFKVAIKTLPKMRDIIDGKVSVDQIRSLSVEDLLAREPVGLDGAPVKRLLEGRSVMVTGAGGSIGSELCRQIAALNPATLVMLERYENSLHAIETELRDLGPSAAIHAIVGDVTDAARVDDVLGRYRPDIVFHAAAHKHVPLMEHNPCEAIKNNVRGTRILAAAADAAGVDRFILISTDKAVNPMNVMGASKRMCELIVRAQAKGSGTSFSIVRFGNVLGSNGSVVPRFVEQIRRGGPVTVTHPEMKRFFMLIPEAVQLVLHAAAQAESGTSYVLEMGEPVKLVDMARDLIRLSGLTPDEDISIVFTGLRPGEKLSEQLVAPDEQAEASHIPEILRVRSTTPPPATLLSAVEQLEADAAQGRVEAVRARLASLTGLASAATLLEPKMVGDLRPHSARDDPSRAAQPASGLVFVRAAEEQPCPKCRVGHARRSRTRTIHERAYKPFTARRLFRCSACGWRGWLVPLQFVNAADSAAQAAVDLVSLDQAATPPPIQRRPAFAPRNLSS